MTQTDPTTHSPLSDPLGRFSGVSGTAGPSDRSQALAAFLDQNGKEILLNPPALDKALKASSLDLRLQLQLQLLSGVPGLSNLVLEESPVVQNDLDRFVKNALETTGLSRSAIQELVADLGTALGYPVITTRQKLAEWQGSTRAFVVPPAVYRSELAALRGKLSRKQPLSQEDIQMLETLSRTGVGEAACLWGESLMEESPSAALDLLTQAAQDGSAEAQAMIGDYYYRQGPSGGYSMAEAIYTGYGSAALTRERHAALCTILNEKRYNRFTLLFGGILLALMLAATLVLSLAPQISMGIPLVGILALVVNCALLGVGVFLLRARPYDSIPFLIPAMFGVWCVYMATWCIV